MKMQTISGTADGKTITILYEGNDRECSLTVAYGPPINRVVVDDVFRNPVLLSAVLASELGLGPARDFLHANGVPPESQLWHLNHSGWAPPNPGNSFGFG